MRFGSELLPSQIQLALTSQAGAGHGPEYMIQRGGSYLRFERNFGTQGPVALMERTMLDVCTATFAELAAHYATKITEPPPPRYRRFSSRGPSDWN